jgi:lauroyl/myristoyl acyltransferase
MRTAARPQPPPTEQELRALLPELEDEALRAALAVAASLPDLHRAFAERRRRGEVSEGRVRLRDEGGFSARAAARQPMVLITWHFGLVRQLAPGLLALGTDLLALRHRPAPGPLALREEFVGEGVGERARALATSIAHLRNGGSVILAADGPGRPRLRVPCLGRRLGLARGAFALSRLTGAPVVPVVGLARGDELEIVVDPPLVAPAGATGEELERALAAAASAWLEGLVRRHPGQLLHPLRNRLLRSRPLRAG